MRDELQMSTSWSWCRLWHEMPTDPKWRTIAKKSGQRIGDVMAVYCFLMVNASVNANERGRTHNFSPEDVAAALDLEPTEVEAILDAMQGKVLDKDRLMGWEKRQPKREDGAAERARAWRERNRTQANAHKRSDTDTDTEKKKERDPKKDLQRKNGHTHAKAELLAPKPAEIPMDLWATFLLVRKEKKAPLTKRAMAGIVRECEKAGITVEQGLQLCCEKNWQGINAEWKEVKELGGFFL